MTRLIAIDPGSEQSALVAMSDSGKLLVYRKCANAVILDLLIVDLSYEIGDHLAIEMIASYGMPVGKEVFETCVWIGRFIEAWGGHFTQVYRRDVKLHMCGTSRANDANIRASLIDKYGPGKDRAIGTKKTPGPLYGMKADVWAALAVAVTYREKLSVSP